MSGFKPAWWLPNSHLQTIWPVLCRRYIKLPLKRERVNLPDGDFVDVDWLVDQHQDPASPLILVLHGLEGSIESHYARGILRKFSQLGWRGVFMNFRGCSGEPNRLSRGYHSGETNDISFVVQMIQKRYPQAPLGAIGFSLGGNVLLKWLGETKWQNPLKAAIAVSVPFELHKASQRIQRGFSRFYQWYFIKCLRERLREKFEQVPSPYTPELLDQLHTIYEFDDKITAPLHGFSGVNEYYTISSSRQYLHAIQVPTLILHAKDDPFMTQDVIPHEDELSPYVQLEVSEKGGHVGFVTGNIPWRPEYWLEKRTPLFFEEFLR